LALVAQEQQAVVLVFWSARLFWAVLRHLRAMNSRRADATEFSSQRYGGLMRKRIGLKVVKVVASIAAVVFLLVPLATWTQVLLFIGSIVVLLICSVATKNLDDTNDDKDAGYWPNKPNGFL